MKYVSLLLALLPLCCNAFTAFQTMGAGVKISKMQRGQFTMALDGASFQVALDAIIDLKHLSSDALDVAANVALTSGLLDDYPVDASDMASGAADALSGAADALSGAADTVSGTVAGTVDNVIDAVDSASSSVNNLIGQFSSGAEKAQSSFASALLGRPSAPAPPPGVDALVSGPRSLLDSLRASVDQAVAGAAGAVNGAVEGAKSSVAGTLETAKSSVVGTVESTQKSALDAVSTQQQGVTQTLQTQFKEPLDQLNTVSGQAKETYSIVEKEVTGFVSFLETKLTPNTVFTIDNVASLPLWLAMIGFPQNGVTKGLMKSYLPISAFSMLYVWSAYLAFQDPQALQGFSEAITSLPALTKGFGSEVAVATAWAHFIAQDLFVGRFIYLDGLKNGVFTRHSVALAYLFGPAGLLSHLVTRGFVGLLNPGQDIIEAGMSASTIPKPMPQPTAKVSSAVDEKTIRDAIMKDAESKAKLILTEAEAKAAKMLNDAKMKAEEIKAPVGGAPPSPPAAAPVPVEALNKNKEGEN
ncbi:unnamed protein product [Heterosigma akashiwo]|uniref:Uncharacterized protein n=2 Tax=Heterosigma akashiwo TaxID=2829 RepID=A0A7S3Y5E5_HETAK